MSRPLTHQQAFQNRTFLTRLARDGNARAAARAAGVPFGTMMHRRGAHPAFAQKWAEALVSSQARLNSRGGRKGPETRPAAKPGAHRTAGGEPVVVRVKGGRIQVRGAHPGKLTKQCEQAFLSALAATANVRLSARAAGASGAAFYRRKRTNPAFAREWGLALETGYRRVAGALYDGLLSMTYEDADWRRNVPAMPPMTVNQALQSLYLHNKEVSGRADPPNVRRKPRESDAAYEGRMIAIRDAWYQREREKYDAAQAARAAGKWTPDGPEPLYTLPDLAQVTGWSKADPAKQPWNPDRALFGGWRLENLKLQREGEGEE